MRKLANNEWNKIRDAFLYNMSYHNIEDCLSLFIRDYNEILNLDEECEEESLDVYFDRKMKPMWDYVYNLNKTVNSLTDEVNKIRFSRESIQPKPLVSPYTPPTVGTPYSIPNHYTPSQPPFDWYQVKCENGNVPLGNGAAVFTKEQLEEWSKVRFVPK